MNFFRPVAVEGESVLGRSTCATLDGGSLRGLARQALWMETGCDHDAHFPRKDF